VQDLNEKGLDLVSDGKIILCFYEEILKMGISIEISFSAQQCCGGLSLKTAMLLQLM
jgi:hypothetical protein